MAFVAEQGPLPEPTLGLFRLSEGVAGRLNPCLFKCLRLFINESPVFPFLGSRFVLTCQKAAVATFALAPFPWRQKIRLCYFPDINMVQMLLSRKGAPRGKGDRSNGNAL
jgi:hypothetical protein